MVADDQRFPAHGQHLCFPRLFGLQILQRSHMMYLHGISVVTAELACAPQHPDNQLGWLVVVDRYRARQLVYLCHEHRLFLFETVMVWTRIVYGTSMSCYNNKKPKGKRSFLPVIALLIFNKRVIWYMK